MIDSRDVRSPFGNVFLLRAYSGSSGMLYRIARSHVISVQSTGTSEMQRMNMRKWRFVTSIIGATDIAGCIPSPSLIVRDPVHGRGHVMGTWPMAYRGRAF
eukprot:1373854-Prymnesium_polylepis.3